MQKEEKRSEFTQLLVDRFCDAVYPDGKTAASYEMECDYLFLGNAANPYGVETEMLAYAKEHPKATLKELLEYFDSIAPDGLAPGDDGADLLE